AGVGSSPRGARSRPDERDREDHASAVSARAGSSEWDEEGAWLVSVALTVTAMPRAVKRAPSVEVARSLRSIPERPGGVDASTLAGARDREGATATGRHATRAARGE